MLDLAAILALSLFLELGHFGWQSGRTILNADSIQYVDNACALLDPQVGADFSFRKPGYSFILAGALLLFGNVGWGAIALNHVFQALTPLAAYGVGRLLAGRGGGWLAAVLTMARLLGVVHADRIMSEAPYTVLMTLAVLALCAAVSTPRGPLGSPAGVAAGRVRWWAAAGTALAAAWLLRATAVAAIAAGLVTFAVVHREVWRDWLFKICRMARSVGRAALGGRRRGASVSPCEASTAKVGRVGAPDAAAVRLDAGGSGGRACTVAALALCIPISAALILECSLNAATWGQFRPGSGTAGTALYLRTRAWQGDPDAATANTRVIVENFLLRDEGDLSGTSGDPAPPPGSDRAATPAIGPALPFTVGGATLRRPGGPTTRLTLPDVWIAWHRARMQPGWDEWRVDRAMRAAAIDQIAAAPGTYLTVTGRVFLRQVLRLRSGSPLSTGDADASAEIDARREADLANDAAPSPWYLHWGLPHRNPAYAAALVERMQRAADTSAPFSRAEPIRTARYVTMLPAFRRVAAMLASIASLTPAAALLVCAWLGVHRRPCALIAMIYVADAALISLTACSDESLPRFMDAWIGVDAAVVSAGLIVAGRCAWRWVNRSVVVRRPSQPAPPGAHVPVAIGSHRPDCAG